MRKLFALVSALCVSSVVYASFELTYVVDNGGTGNAQVKRFDPNTGAYLGAFGKGYIPNPPYGMCLDQGTQTCYVSTFSNSVLRFNMFTGDFQGEYAFSTTTTGYTSVAQNGNLLKSTGTTIGLFSSTGSLQNTFGSGLGANFNSVVQAANGNYYALDQTAGRLYSFTSAGVYQNYMTVATSYVFNQMTTYMNRIVWSTSTTSATSDRIYTVDAIAGGASNYHVWDPGVPTYSLRGTSLGHDNVVHYSFTNASSQAVIGSMSTNTGSVYGTFGAGTLSYALSLQNVNAPEPGSLAAMSLGAASLLLRRRRVVRGK